MNRIIFLDIDGVLNDINDMKNNINISKIIYNRAYSYLNWNYEQKKEYTGFNFSFEKIQILKDIIRLTDSKIVLTSSWRNLLMMDALIDKELPVIGMTPYVEQKRGKEIKEYLKNNGCSSFCILDDELCDFEEEGLLDYLVRTDGYSYNGLSYDLIPEIIEVLSYEVDHLEEQNKSLKFLRK